MMTKRIPLAALAALAALIGVLLAAVPARAQVGPDADVYVYGRPGPDRDAYGRRPPPLRDHDWPRDRYDRPRRGGSVCVTARGDCPTPPAPYDAPCECEMPGFGFRRGRIGG